MDTLSLLVDKKCALRSRKLIVMYCSCKEHNNIISHLRFTTDNFYSVDLNRYLQYKKVQNIWLKRILVVHTMEFIIKWRNKSLCWHRGYAHLFQDQFFVPVAHTNSRTVPGLQRTLLLLLPFLYLILEQIFHWHFLRVEPFPNKPHEVSKHWIILNGTPLPLLWRSIANTV